jgi:hypothetical protein
MVVSSLQILTDECKEYTLIRAYYTRAKGGFTDFSPEPLSPPDLDNREQDGTATWSLATLQRALQRAPDGLPQVSCYPIWVVLRDSGWRWQRNRSWCPTGTALRKRKTGVVLVHDPDTAAKKLN